MEATPRFPVDPPTHSGKRRPPRPPRRTRLPCLFLLVLLSLPPGPLRAEPLSTAVSEVLRGTLSKEEVLHLLFTDQERAEGRRYQRERLYVHLVGLGSVLLFYGLLLGSGLNRRMKKLARRGAAWTYARSIFRRHGREKRLAGRILALPESLFGGRRWLEVLLYCLLFLFLLRLFFLPQTFYRSFWLDQRHGLSNYTLALWLVDYAKGLILGTLLFSLMVFGIYGLLARTGRRWWVLLWAGVSLAIFGYVAVAPYAARIYHDFRVLPAGELRSRLEALTASQDVPLKDILVVDASRRTKKVNAYFEGSGPSQRIVLYDTLLEHFTPREITMILAHELAHWREPHEFLSYGVFSLTVFFVLGLADHILRRGTACRALSYTSVSDVAGLPVLFLTFFLLFQVLRPLNLYWKRAREVKADRASLEMVCDPEAFVSMHVKLARLNHADVDPPLLLVYLFASHPPFLERIEVARRASCSAAPLGTGGSHPGKRPPSPSPHGRAPVQADIPAAEGDRPAPVAFPEQKP